MNLPPLANLFAVHRDDPESLEDIAGDLQLSGEFTHVWRPARGWVVGSAALPRCEADSAMVKDSGFVFAEGRDAVEGPWPAARADRLAQTAAMTDVAPESLGSISGDFGFIRFRHDGTATAVRSCGGLVPFYLWQSGRNVAVSTRLGDLVRFLPEEPRIDPLPNAAWTLGYGPFPDRRTFLAGVTIVDRGCAATLRPDRQPSIQQYWQPRQKHLLAPTPARAAEHAEYLRTLLTHVLRRDLDPEGGNLLTLSGGVDSSSLLALARGVVNRPVWTWSFLPGPDALLDREMRYIEPLVNAFGVERSWSHHVWNLGDIPDLLYQAPPVVFHVMHPALCSLPAIVREAPVHVLFGGEFADEICGGAGTTPDWAAHTSAVGLISSAASLPSGAKDVLRWTKHRALERLGKPVLPLPGKLPSFIRSEVRDEYREWHDRRRRSAATDHDDRRFLHLCAEIGNWVVMNWEAASALGVRRSFPFFNREVLELAFACHPSELVGPGHKKLLRAALHADVPAMNLSRTSKGGWGRALPNRPRAMTESLPDALAPIVADAWIGSSRPAATTSTVRGLVQLKVFADALASRRGERTTRKKMEGSRLYG